MHRSTTRLAGVLATVLLGGGLAAQSDLRDEVVLKNGKTLRGRVIERFGDDEVLVLQGSRRVRVKHKQVESITTVNDHMREFFAHRQKARGNVDREWLLVEWATSRDLTALANLQAMHVALLDPGHEKAHRHLGHRPIGADWLWRRGDRLMPFDAYEHKTSEFGSPKLIEGEHFRLRTNASLRRAVDTLFDLERFYVFWFEEFGEALGAREVTEWMDFHLHRDRDDFPPLTSTAIPYYFPQPNGDVAYTYFAANSGRAELLFQTAQDQILYNALLHGVAPFAAESRDRIAGWIEVGLGQWVEGRFAGDPGYAEPGPARLNPSYGHVAEGKLPYKLPNLLGVRYGLFHDPSSQRPAHWAMATTFVAFLMDDAERRDKLLSYMKQAYRESRGNSSSLFDRAMGTKIEALERPWREWVAGATGAAATDR
ncbi:MAG: hypothetical protein AAF628_33700 [Planctomycetota bacterium]